MRILLLFILISRIGFSQTEESERIFPEDKMLHLSAGYVSSVITSSVLAHYNVKHSVWYGFGVGAALGVGKEFYDEISGNGKPEVLDMVACITGAGLGSLTIHFAINPRYKVDKYKSRRKI